MGQNNTSFHSRNSIKKMSGDHGQRYEASEVPATNGHMFYNSYLPGEIIALILSYVGSNSLLECQYVCRNWYEIISDQVWQLKAHRDFRHRFVDVKPAHFIKQVYQGICLRDAYGKNLLKNNSGQNGFQDWTITNNGGNEWQVERPPVGVLSPADADPNAHSVCFVTSHGLCAKEQKIDLFKEGIPKSVLKEYSLEVTVLEWYARRWDCEIIYDMSVSIANENNTELLVFSFITPRQNSDGWKQVKTTFRLDGLKGARYIIFRHSGKDQQFWAGHYGSKMADACVEIKLSGLTSKLT